MAQLTRGPRKICFFYEGVEGKLTGAGRLPQSWLATFKEVVFVHHHDNEVIILAQDILYAPFQSISAARRVIQRHSNIPLAIHICNPPKLSLRACPTKHAKSTFE